MKTNLKFCKKCNGLMKPIGTHIFSGEHIFKCVECNHEEKGKDLIKTEKIYESEIKEGVVIDKNIFADYPFKCKKCGYNKAEVIERQPNFSDEDTLTYLKCGKCGWTENLSRKIS